MAENVRPAINVSAQDIVKQREILHASEWDQLAATQEFKELVAAKKGAIIPATIFFIVYYFALPASVGYFPDFMDTRVIGNINIAYLFALSQFFVAWAIAAWYTRVANNVFDRLADAVKAYRRGGAK